jgi:hypothetical protein
MPSEKHQMLQRLLAQKMTADGYSITHWDGRQCNAAGGGGLPWPLPIPIGKHRPDIIAIKKDDHRLAIGEAKTPDDISNPRSKRQLLDFSSASINGNPSQVYIAIPQSCRGALIKLMIDCKLIGQPNIYVLAVPEVLLKEERYYV